MNDLGIEWISDICDFEVYQELELKDSMSFQIGQIYVGPIKHPFSPPKVLQCEYFDPSNEQNCRFSISKCDLNEPKQNIPIKSINLQSDERLYILQGKNRPVIILGYCHTAWGYSATTKKGKEKLILCLPLFTFKPRHIQEYMIKILLFDIPNLFYLESSGKGLFHDSAARFELIQPIHKVDLSAWKNSNSKPIRLSDDTLKLLWNHLSIFLSSKPLYEDLQEDLKAYAEMIKEKIGWL